KESDSRTAVADIKPVIEPEPSLAMNDYKSRENYDSAWEQHAKKTEEASPTLPQPAITPPVLKTPRPVGEIAAAGTPKKVNGMSFYKGDASGKAKTISSRAALAKSVAIGKTTQDMPDSRHTQNIIIETTNVGQTQMKLENYMKSNRIQIVSSQKFHEAAVVDARKSELNQNIQSLATWADKEPVKLEYHIKTSETQACQINADLAQNFPNAQNILPSIKNSGLAVRENDGERMRGKLAESNLADSSVTNAIDANPIMMTITIQQRSQNQAIPTATCKPASVTTSAPATQPLSQPTTAPAK
ncbi:MAG TPA: hypothetical protein PKK48_10255, partial [Phycisphaerae bacterium]|nr:hypothetical protein [Phycisphaerae bacterium]